jgi:hypothetical protein
MHAIELSDDGAWTLFYVIAFLVVVALIACVKGAS